MELRHLRYFLAVAEQRHFTRAARLLNISQQPLSVAIRQLESELGRPLFMRTTRSVSLTAAGEIFAVEAQRVLDQLASAVAAVTKPAPTALLRVAYPTTFGDLPQSAVPVFRKRRPAVDVQLLYRPPSEQEAAVIAREVDIGIIVPPVRSPLLRYTQLVSEELLLCLWRGHPLARRRRIAIAELANEGFVQLPLRTRSAVVAVVRHACERAGFTPHVVSEATTVSALHIAVAHRLGIAFTGGRHELSPPKGVVLRRLVEAPQLTFGAIIRRDAGDTTADHTAVFLRAVRARVRQMQALATVADE